MKFGGARSDALASSLDRCSNTYRPLVVVSLIAAVFVDETSPLIRKATTATMRMQATPSVTMVSTSVNPISGPLRPGIFGAELMVWP
jgi:hypothetical protein